MKLKSISKLLIGVCAFWGAACNSGAGNQTTGEVEQEQGEVNIYTHRHYDVDKKLFQQFEDSTGIKVNVVSANADELIVKLKQEGPTTNCDLLITTDAARMYKAKTMNLLKATHDKAIGALLPNHLVDADGYWYGLAQRARVIAVKKGLKDKYADWNYEDLAKPEWKGKVIMRSSESSYNQSLMSNLIAHHSEEWAINWVKEVVANFAREPKGNDRDQVKDIAAGEGEITFVNSYYLGKLEFSPDPAARFAFSEVDIIFPNQNTTGTFVDVSAAAVTKYAKNETNALRLLKFLLSKESQTLIANMNYEYPAIEGVDLQASILPLSDFKRDTLNLEKTGELNTQAVVSFDKGGWR